MGGFHFGQLASWIGSMPWLDWAALVCGWACLGGYAAGSGRMGQSRASLLGASYLERKAWGEAMLRRDNRIVDASLIASLNSVNTFFASTTILIVGALLALLGAPSRVADIGAAASALPWSEAAGAPVEAKLALLMSFFGYAFFKFTWAIRQLNFAALCVGSAPLAGTMDGTDMERKALRFADLASFSGESFAQGLRAYYFAFASAAWLWNPWACAAACALVAAAMARRDFLSPTVASLTGSGGIQAKRYARMAEEVGGRMGAPGRARDAQGADGNS